MAELPPRGAPPPRLTVIQGVRDSASSASEPAPEGLAALEEHFDGRRSKREEGKPQGEAVRSLTDMGNAERLIGRHGPDLRYCHARGTWLVWDGCRWRWDEKARVMQLAKEATRAIASEARAATDAAAYKGILAHAIDSESARRQHAMVRLASYEQGVPVAPDELDTDRFLLTVENGTVDLRQGVLRPHRKEDLITKLAPVRFDPAATCPRWEAFLHQILAQKAHLVAFLQRALGWALTGDVSEQVLFFLHGDGSNGKSTMLNVVMRLLGDYARQAPEELLLSKNLDGGHPTEKAMLMGARLVVCMEIQSNRRLNEAVVKQLTGGDRISARFMRQDFFEFWPTHKLFLAANHKPGVGDTDHGIWRRILLLPFSVQIPEEQKDPDLSHKLLAEGPGILNWMVQGCLAWQRQRLSPPPEVRAATREYREEEDALAPFFSDCCVLGEQHLASAAELYGAYRRWCERTHERRPYTQKRLGNRLRERGFARERSASGHILWRGLGLLEQHRSPEQRELQPRPAPEASEASEPSPGIEPTAQPHGEGSGESVRDPSDGSAPVQKPLLTEDF